MTSPEEKLSRQVVKHQKRSIIWQVHIAVSGSRNWQECKGKQKDNLINQDRYMAKEIYTLYEDKHVQ